MARRPAEQTRAVDRTGRRVPAVRAESATVVGSHVPSPRRTGLPASGAHPVRTALVRTALVRTAPVRTAPVRTSAVGAVLTAVLLAACTPGSSGPTAPAPTPVSTTAPSADAPPPVPSPTTDPGETGLHLVVDGSAVALIEVDGSGTTTATATPDPDSGLVLTLTVPDPGAVVTLDLPEAAGGSARTEADRSAALRHADGTLAVGAAAPQSTGADGTQPRVAWSESGPEGPSGDSSTGSTPTLLLDLGSADAAAFPLVVTTHLGTSVVASTAWGDREGGRSLAVTPTDWGRVSGATGAASAWADLLAADPSADTPGMEKQLQCHLLGARDKATWNLEPWRPDVSLVEYALARCNPT